MTRPMCIQVMHQVGYSFKEGYNSMVRAFGFIIFNWIIGESMFMGYVIFSTLKIFDVL